MIRFVIYAIWRVDDDQIDRFIIQLSQERKSVSMVNLVCFNHHIISFFPKILYDWCCFFLTSGAFVFGIKLLFAPILLQQLFFPFRIHRRLFLTFITNGLHFSLLLFTSAFLVSSHMKYSPPVSSPVSSVRASRTARGTFRPASSAGRPRPRRTAGPSAT